MPYEPEFLCPICGIKHGSRPCKPEVYHRIDRMNRRASEEDDWFKSPPRRLIGERLEEGFLMLRDNYAPQVDEFEFP